MKKAWIIAAVMASSSAAYAAMTPTSVLPGTSYASRALVQHTLSRIYPQLAKSAGCNSKVTPMGFGVIKSSIVEEPHTVLVSNQQRTQWSEEWTLGVCGKRQTTVVQFLSSMPPAKANAVPVIEKPAAKSHKK